MALIGAILGDIAGSRYEFCNNVDWENCELFADNCEFTDDTVMSLAVKKALMEKMSYADAMQVLGRQYPDAGYGSHFRWWLNQDNRKPYNSYGNGAAMRISFIPDFYERLEDVQEAAKQSAEISHNHPEGIKGAVVAATCIWMAKHGKDKDEILEYAISEYPPEQYPKSGKDIAWLRENAHYDITCQGSVPVAVRCFYESSDFESFMRLIFSIECDRDTIGAIGGGIVEEYYHGFGFDAESILKQYLDPLLLELAHRKFKPCKKMKKPPFAKWKRKA